MSRKLPEEETFYFFRNRRLAFIYASLYARMEDAIRVAHEVDRITGLRTQILRQAVPALKMVSNSKVILLNHPAAGA